MNELVVIVEGATEQTFVRNQLAGHLAVHGINSWAVLPGKHRKQGGVRKWAGAQQDIVRTLREKRYCTTMFDYYAMPLDWPGRRGASAKTWNERATWVEQAIFADIVSAMGQRFDPKFFIPYVQLHEFEALAFADVDVLARSIAPVASVDEQSLANAFAEILEEAGHPEAINDGFETCPSRRIIKAVPAYKKAVYGPIVTERIGMDTLRARCTHYGEWIAKLERIGST